MKQANIIEGKTLDEYMAKYGKYYKNGVLWDFTEDDVRTGAVELNRNIYWHIGDRYYEVL